jgi:glycosyltransferase involved in cell wall biosynthesis
VAALALALRDSYRTCVFIAPGAERHYDLTGVPVIEVEMTGEGILAAVEAQGIDLVLDHYHWNAAHVRMMAGLAEQGLRVVLTEHNAFHHPLFQATREHLHGQELWFDDRYAYYARFCAVTVLTEDTRRAFSRHLDNVRQIFNPLPYPVDAPAAPRAPTVLNVSSFIKPAKRMDLLYASFAAVQPAVPDARLVIAGDCDWLKDRYLQLATGVDPRRLRCVGRTRRVQDYYAQASVFALTSEIEGQPMVLLEAAHHGLPQVAFDLPGLNDQVIEGKTGHLVPFGDTEAFAARLIHLLKTPERAQAMGRAARAFVARTFPVERIAQEWRDLIDEIDRKGRIFAPKASVTARMTRQEAAGRAHWQAVARHARPATEPAIAPKISFLVPVHGTEDVLARCLDSIATQTLTEFECIVVDDGSPGDVAGVFDRIVGDDARFRLVRHDCNRGLHQARTTAAEAARGLYFAHVDSDDYIHRRFAEVMFAEALTTGAEIVECQAVEFGIDGLPAWFNTILPHGPVDGAEAARAFLSGRVRNVVWNKIYARDLWRRTPLHDTIDVGLTICEDVLRNGLLFPECRRYSSVQDCLYFYCRRQDSVVQGGDFVRLLAKLRDVELAYHTVKARQSGPAAIRQLEGHRQKDLRWYLAEFLGRTDPAEVQRQMNLLLAAPDFDPALGPLIDLVKAQTDA